MGHAADSSSLLLKHKSKHCIRLFTLLLSPVHPSKHLPRILPFRSQTAFPDPTEHSYLPIRTFDFCCYQALSQLSTELPPYLPTSIHRLQFWFAITTSSILPRYTSEASSTWTLLLILLSSHGFAYLIQYSQLLSFNQCPPQFSRGSGYPFTFVLPFTMRVVKTQTFHGKLMIT
ncbi:hypothetical protein L209DRAFT_541642 [Thermothelomyces heterothallicus CBS 203.75]